MATYKGFFKPLNPEKYRGNPTNIVYRSRWELVYMARLDKDPDVIWWQSEETVIPYRSPVDKKIHRYFPDFVVKRKTEKGSKTQVIEIKPKFQTVPPTTAEGKKKSKKLINEAITWGINNAKWESAREYCKDRGYEFVILTEKELGLPF